jgi:predicted glycogen debranching enzyme
MVLQFGRDICSHLATAESREWLVTNGIGGYACGTIAGLLTRHYHGLLNAALQPPLGRTLLVAKLDEIVTYEGQTYALHCDRWADGHISAHGYCYLEHFHLAGTIPTWHYALADARLVKQVWMEQGANTTYSRYSVTCASSPLHLSLKALVNYRNHHHRTQGQGWQMQIEPLVGSIHPLAVADGGLQVSPWPDAGGGHLRTGLKVTAFEGATPFYLLSDRGSCVPHHEWYQGYTLAIEQYRGIDPYDDHLHGGTFEVALNAQESITLVATTTSPDRVQCSGALPRQRHHEQQLLSCWQSARSPQAEPAPDWLEPLVLAADQFVVARPVDGAPDGKTVIAGYPWFGDWGRDTMIALPGLAIATGRSDLARPILRTFANYIDQGMLPNAFPEAGAAPGYNTVDAVLWYFEAIRAYQAASQDQALIDELFPVLADIIDWHQRGTRYAIHLDSDGLISAGEEGAQLTWMDAKVGDWVVTPRLGKPIEINALWYNALLIMAHFAELLGVSGETYRAMAQHTRQGFQRFWSGRLGYCYDVLDGPQGHDASLRPNQLFAVALPASAGRPLSTHRPRALGPPLLIPKLEKAIVDTVAQQLLTSYGVRSLAPTHPDYQGHYGGSPLERDGAYHQGTVWSWLIGPFIQAHLRVYQNPAVARTFLAPFADHLREACLGSISEIFDGDVPHIPRGAFAQAWSVAEVLRSWWLIENFTPFPHQGE